jgi:hypothetical protein
MRSIYVVQALDANFKNQANNTFQLDGGAVPLRENFLNNDRSCLWHKAFCALPTTECWRLAVFKSCRQS